MIDGGIGTPGLTRVWNVPRHSPPRSLTAPTSVISQVAGDAPVVSRSTTQNVTVVQRRAEVVEAAGGRDTADYGEHVFERQAFAGLGRL